MICNRYISRMAKNISSPQRIYSKTCILCYILGVSVIQKTELFITVKKFLLNVGFMRIFKKKTFN